MRTSLGALRAIGGGPLGYRTRSSSSFGTVERRVSDREPVTRLLRAKP